MLVFSAEVKRASVLQVRGEDDGLVTGFPWELHAQVPSIEGGKGEFAVFGYEMLGCKGVEPVNGIAEGASVPDMLPCEGGQAG